MRRSLLVVSLFLVLAAPARAGGPSMVLGANEGAFKQHTLVEAKANLTLAKLAGFQAVKVSEFWYPELTEPPESDLGRLGNMTKAARLLGMPVYISITNTLGRDAPQTEEERDQFVQFAVKTARALPSIRHIAIGNEPNLNRFWAPQFGEDGSDVAARSYERLLALTYDGLKRVSRKIVVLGGAISPRGHDDPNFSSKSHSPTVFIRDLGEVYRASGRKRPIMDWLAFHPYQANSSEPPTTRHLTSTSITIGDYDKLVKALGSAFDGTKQLGSKLPIAYDEYGLESTIPRKKRKKYTGVEPPSTKPISPALQGERYRQAIQLAFCAPNVKAMFLFHAFDEPDLDRWQSGLYYVDKTAKPSLRTVRTAFGEVRRGVSARCPGMRLAVKGVVKFLSPAKAAAAGKKGSSIRFVVRCNLDCNYTSGVIDSHGHSVLAALGRAIGGKKKTVKLPARKLQPGRYRVAVSLVAAVNPGRAARKQSHPFTVR